MPVKYACKAHNHIKLNFNFPRYSLQTSFKVSHNFIIMAHGHLVKWLLMSSRSFCAMFRKFCFMAAHCNLSRTNIVEFKGIDMFLEILCQVRG